jgi:large subunit ribosomal protein L25
MAREIADLVVEKRTRTGKGAARAARRNGMVPGVVYGDNQEPLAIQINYNTLLKHLKAGRFLQTLFNLKVDGEEDVHVVCRAVQRDVVKDLPTHVDFMRLHDESRIVLHIHVNFENQDASPGLKRGGTLTVVRPEVELEVLAGDIPDHITVDLTGKQIGDVIHIGDVKLPEGVKPTIARNFVIANISAPVGLVEA